MFINKLKEADEVKHELRERKKEMKESPLSTLLCSDLVLEIDMYRKKSDYLTFGFKLIK